MTIVVIYTEEGKSMGVKTISTKISREEYTRLQYYCKSKNETINSFLKKKVLSEIDNPQTTKIAGKSVFEYNTQKDNFSWKIILDDNSSINVDNDVPSNTIEQLLESLMDAVDKRKSMIKKSMSDSVSFPSKLVKI